MSTPRLPRDAVQEVIGAQHLVIIEYLVKVLCSAFSRGDTGQSGCKNRINRENYPRRRVQDPIDSEGGAGL